VCVCVFFSFLLIHSDLMSHIVGLSRIVDEILELGSAFYVHNICLI
jgi:hypothetical protein